LVLQEVNARLTEHIDEGDTSFTLELAIAVRPVPTSAHGPKGDIQVPLVRFCSTP
jgi:hypothetical protein